MFAREIDDVLVVLVGTIYTVVALFLVNCIFIRKWGTYYVLDLLVRKFSKLLRITHKINIFLRITYFVLVSIIIVGLHSN